MAADLSASNSVGSDTSHLDLGICVEKGGGREELGGNRGIAGGVGEIRCTIDFCLENGWRTELCLELQAGAAPRLFPGWQFGAVDAQSRRYRFLHGRRHCTDLAVLACGRFR